jgi:O-antigen ligase
MVDDPNPPKRTPWALAPLVLYLLLVPLLAVGARNLGGHDLARIAQVTLGGLCAMAWAAAALRAAAPGPRGLAGSAALLVLALASVLHAASTAMALREMTLFLGMASIAAVVALTPGAARASAWTTSAASGLYAALVLSLATAALLSGAPLDRPALFVGYDNHRLFNHVQTAALPMALATACTAELPRALRRLAWLALVAGCALLFASAGRGTFVALLAAALVVWALVGPRAWHVVRALAVALTAGFLLFAVVFILLPWLSPVGVPAMADYAPGRITSDQARLYLWRLAWEQIASAPWLGIGPMHAAHWPNLKAAHPHNIYLQLAAEWGIPVLVATLAAGGAFVYRMVRAIGAAGASQSRMGTALAIGCLAVAADGFVSGNFVMPVSQVWIAVLVGWALAWMRAARSAEGEESRQALGASIWAARAIAAFALVMHLWLAWSIAPEVRDLEAHLERAREDFPSERTQPRFWSHGRF